MRGAEPCLVLRLLSYQLQEQEVSVNKACTVALLPLKHPMLEALTPGLSNALRELAYDESEEAKNKKLEQKKAVRDPKTRSGSMKICVRLNQSLWWAVVKGKFLQTSLMQGELHAVAMTRFGVLFYLAPLSSKLCERTSTRRPRLMFSIIVTDKDVDQISEAVQCPANLSCESQKACL